VGIRQTTIHSAITNAVSSSFFFVGAGFIPARNTGCLAERVGIKPTPDGDDVERYMHQLMSYVYSVSLSIVSNNPNYLSASPDS
jgi:hypothetical protein